jgi:ubiquinone biosynthesis protein
LGPTYIQLGQVLSLREDILPRSVTEELKNLLDRLPIVTFDRYRELIEEALGRPVSAMFAEIGPVPIGSASIAQTHLATTIEGERVIIKLVKPGIKKTLQRDARLIVWLGTVVDIFLPHYQPRKVLSEFTEYTAREVDLRLEANNAESFAANFKEQPDIRFPMIYRKYSCESVLVMEFFDGLKPDSAAAQALSLAEREHLLDLGAQAIIRMLYKDGFFHADLHPGNLIILNRKQAGFIDLGMVGRFDDKLRRTLLYYYYCLVIGDAENAARYLASVAQVAKGGRPDAFRREVEEISRRWARTANFAEFSLGQLIMESVSMGGRYRIYFPMEMVLMVKALVTFEGVGNILVPSFDVATLSKKHISKLFVSQFNPVGLIKESLRGAPEVVDALVQAPLLITQGLRFLEEATKSPAENPLSGLRGTMFAGFAMIAGTMIVVFKPEQWELSLPFYLIAAGLVLRRSS